MTTPSRTNAHWLEQQQLKIIDIAARKGYAFSSGPNDYDPKTGLGSHHLGDFVFMDKGAYLTDRPEIRTRIILHTLDHSLRTGKPWVPSIPEIFADYGIGQDTTEAEINRKILATQIENTVHDVARKLDNPNSELEAGLLFTMTPDQRALFRKDYRIDVPSMPYSSPELIKQLQLFDEESIKGILSSPMARDLRKSGELQSGEIAESLISRISKKKGPRKGPPPTPDT